MHPRLFTILSLLAGLCGQAVSQVPPGFLLSDSGSGVTASDGLARVRETPIDLAELSLMPMGAAIPLPLFDGITIVAEVTAMQRAASGSLSIQGRIPGDALGGIALSVEQGQLSGSIWCARGNFGLSPTGRADAQGRAIVEIREWAPGAAVRCRMTRDRDLIAPGDTRLLRRFEAQPVTPLSAAPTRDEEFAPSQGACACGDDQATIDVMFVYTTLARNAAGGAAALQARVSDAVASCNIAFTQSGVNGGAPANRLRARVAGFAEIGYDEVSPEWLDHLSRLANPADGFIDSAITLRDQYHADTVCLIVDDTRFTGGAAYYAVYVRDAAAEVLNWRALGGGSLTFAHELGHNFGCAHDRGNSSFSLFTYAWGHWFAANNTTYGTIMSYTGNVFLPIYSNPTIISFGRPSGVPLDQPLPAYNALAISQTRWLLASYGDSGGILDCNGNGLDDASDISAGRSADVNGNCRPDECEYRLYVDAGNAGAIDGLSWNTAYRDLGEAMAFASLNCSNVSEIWVADGVYRPGRGTADRYARFDLRGGLALLGGFQGKSRPGGGETSPAQRAFSPDGVAAFPSVLTGDIGAPGVHTDNSFNVLAAQECGRSAILDGFTIERGYQDYQGAGIWISNASPAIRNCTFRNNRSGGSGAVDVVGSLSDPLIERCVFENNTAVGSGGCVGIRDGANATFQQCAFRTSTATYGGAAALYNGAAATFRGCTFSDNSASINSGAIDCYLNNQLTLEGCRLLRNHAAGGSGGGLILHTGCSATFDSCEFTANTAAGTGGGLWLQSSAAVLSDCALTSNTAHDGGGAASAYGGAALTLNRCRVAENSARWGGAVAVGTSMFAIRNSALHHNAALAGNGGGLDIFGATGSTILSSALTANTSTDGGGGISLGSGSDLSIINSTIAANRGANSGGGIGMFSASLTVANTILWGNTSGVPGSQSLQDQQLRVFSGSRAVNRSCVQGLAGSLGGVGNIGANPRLTDVQGGDAALLAGSPCIDAGSNALLPVGATTDLLGGDRRIDDPDTADTGVGTAPIVDMGAVEFSSQSGSCPADFNQDGGIDGADVDAFFAAWEAGDSGADVNQDGGVDGGDVATFFFVWEAGGC